MNIFLMQCYQCFITSVGGVDCALCVCAAAATTTTAALKCNSYRHLASDFADPLVSLFP